MENITILIVKFMIPFLVGGLVFFSTVVAPNTFKSLDKKNSRLFIRGIFPKIYFYSGIISFIIFLLLLIIDSFLSSLFLIITLGYLFSGKFLMKKINFAADMKKDKTFKKLHSISVIIFLSQLLLMIGVFLLIQA